MLLETVRGCRFRCKYCYYPEGRSPAAIPLGRTGPGQSELCRASTGRRKWCYWTRRSTSGPISPVSCGCSAAATTAGGCAFSGELRAEGIDAPRGPAAPPGQLPRSRGRAAIGRAAGVGTDGPADGPGGVSSGASGRCSDEGIKVRVDLILGLPGETADSVRRGIDFLLAPAAVLEVQVFNLSILPGTAFRRRGRAAGAAVSALAAVLRVAKRPRSTCGRPLPVDGGGRRRRWASSSIALPPPRLDLFRCAILADRGPPYRALTLVRGLQGPPGSGREWGRGRLLAMERGVEGFAPPAIRAGFVFHALVSLRPISGGKPKGGRADRATLAENPLHNVAGRARAARQSPAAHGGDAGIAAGRSATRTHVPRPLLQLAPGQAAGVEAIGRVAANAPRG